MSFTATPRTWVASEIVTATEMNTEVRDALKGIAAVWTTWSSPVAAGLTIGNGTMTASYIQVGKTVDANLTFTLGSTSVVGVASFTLPVAAVAGTILGTNLGSGNVLDFSVGSASRQPAAAMAASTTTFFFATTGGQMNATTPFTWATGDIMSCSLTYQAA